MNTILQDLRRGFRQLRRSPGFAAVLVLALAVGVGTDAALFRFLDARLGGSERLLAMAGVRRAPEWPTISAVGRTGCVHVAVIGIHTTVSFRIARRSSEIGVHVALGDAGGGPCA